MYKSGMNRGYHVSDDSVKRTRRTHSLMSADDVAAGKKSDWKELEISGHVRNLSSALWSYTHLTTLYLNDNLLSRLPSEISQMKCLLTLDLSNNKLRSLPAELGDLIQLRTLDLGHNQLRILPYELGKLFKLHVLNLKGNPLNPEILSVCSEPNGTSKLLTWLLDHLQVGTRDPPSRPWNIVSIVDRTRPACTITVTCYNVLCDKYATRQMYGYCPSWALSWSYRKKGIMEQIRHYATDVIALQEVETEQFYDFFKPELERDGYEGIFSPKSRAKTMCESERKHVDGCAIFFRSRKFRLISSHLVEFNQLAMANHEGSDDMLNRVMTKDNIGLVALLETKDQAWEGVIRIPEPSEMHQPLLVCTCHIHWDPEFCDVKLIQTMMLMRELETIILKSGYRSVSSDLPLKANEVNVLICGDFNSLPNSGVTEFLSKKKITLDHPDFKGLSYKHCLRKLTNCTSDKTSASGITEFDHPFHLECSYGPDVLPYTNFTYDFKGIIDYVFHSKNTMRTLGILGPIDQNWLAENKIVGCPHPHVPSDHFPLVCEIEMKPTGPVYRVEEKNGEEGGGGTVMSGRPTPTSMMNGRAENGRLSSSSSPSPAHMLGRR